MLGISRLSALAPAFDDMFMIVRPYCRHTDMTCGDFALSRQWEIWSLTVDLCVMEIESPVQSDVEVPAVSCGSSCVTEIEPIESTHEHSHQSCCPRGKSWSSRTNLQVLVLVLEPQSPRLSRTSHSASSPLYMIT